MTTDNNNSLTLELTADVVSAYVNNNPLAADQLPNMIKTIYECLSGLDAPEADPVAERGEPAESIRRSLQDDHLVCLEDGKKFKSLKRHIKSSHGMTPEQYREKWGLKPDYPMTAPAYSERRSKLAKDIGLGRKSSK